MGEIFHCGETEALVGFLYEECEVDERALIAAHLAVCSSCAAELAALSGTRQQLSAWTPPDAQLDFRLTGNGTPAARAPWWSNPLPAWAQLAAALLIFASGTGLGVAVSRSQAWAAAVPAADLAGVDRAELARLNQRVRAIEHRAVPTAHVSLDDTAREGLATLVRQEIYESDIRNQKQLARAIISINQERAREMAAVAATSLGPIDISARFGQRREE